MNKIIKLIVSAAVVLGFAGCSKTKEDLTIAQSLAKTFKETVKKEDSLESLANTLVNDPVIEFGGVTMPIEPGYVNGFSEDVDGFTEGYFFGPMIGSIPFVGYVFTVEGDVNKFVEQLKSKGDLAWNICTCADEMVVESDGNTVFFVMAPESFEE